MQVEISKTVAAQAGESVHTDAATARPQSTANADAAASGTVPVVAGAQTVATQSQTISGNSTQPSPEPDELANHGSPASNRNTALIPAIEKIESIQYQAPDFKDAEELKAAFEEADGEVKAKGRSAIDSQADVIIALLKMQAILSQRGKEKMRRQAGIKQTWTQYYEWFQKEFNFDLTLRSVQYKIRELAGKKRERKCKECHKTGGHAKSCSRYSEPSPPHLTQLEARLLDTASRAHEIVKAVRQAGNVDAAIADFEKNAPTPDKLVEYAERPVKPSLADTSAKPQHQSGAGLDDRKMLVELLDQIEKLGQHVPVSLHYVCRQYRSSMGLSPNVQSKSNGAVPQQTLANHVSGLATKSGVSTRADVGVPLV